MSFILDALRKSEHERQRNRAPGIADMRAPQKQNNRSYWIPLVALLAGLNLALLGVLWFMGGDTNATDTNTPSTNTATNNLSVPAARPAPERVVPRDARRLSAELEAQPEPEESLEPSRFASIAPPSVSEAVVNNQPKSRIPTVREAMLSGDLSVKPMHLDIHVYSSKPSERFVFINTNRYSEGDQTSEGPTVDTINEEGVILNYQGRDYLLTRD